MTTQRAPAGAAVQRPAVTHAISVAVLDELAEQGFERLSMEGVARRAGVGKSALYRRWPAKVAMVTDALAAFSTPVRPVTSTGDVRVDLRVLLAASRDWLREPRIREVLPDLIAASQYDPDLAEATRIHISTPRRAWAEQLLAHAPYRDRIADPVVELLLDLAVAPLFWRTTHGRAIDDDTVDRLVDLIVDPLVPPAARERGTALDSTPTDVG